jgi:hypothetical protein
MISPQHPLIGKLVRFDDEERWTVSRVDADLGNGYLLARRLSPATGDDLRVSHVVSLSALSDLGTEVGIFAIWADMVAWMEQFSDH